MYTYAILKVRMLLFLLALLFPFWEGRRWGDAVEDIFCPLNFLEEGVCFGSL
jgi:hypothetical protein